MVLNDEQCMRFFDTMDALLYYVNDRFRIVEGLVLESQNTIDDMKTAIVAHELWGNTDIIDSFIQENPAQLPQSCLKLAEQWKDALPGFFAVVRYQDGRGLLMNEVGLFSVSGVTEELEKGIGPSPAYVETVLLPFDDIIVYDGFLQAFTPSGDESELQRLQDDFEDRCAQGIVSTAQEFQKVAHAHREFKRSQELDALLAEVEREASHDEEVLPEGFHRGPLAGLSPEERAAALVEARPELAEAAKALQGLSRQFPRDDLTVKMEQVINCAVACAVSRGVVLIDEAYDQYCNLVADPIERDQFFSALKHEAAFPDSYFGVWNHEGDEYLVYFSLTPDYVAQQMSREGRWDGLPDELKYYESYRCSLLDVRREVPVKPLSRTLLENSAMGELLADSSIRRLRDYLDERIPDGADDYLFADRVAEDVALVGLETGSLDSQFAYLRELGLDQSATDEKRLITLVTNVYNAMPSWENNGWSPKELYEQLTGRTMFYNEDGSVKHVGSDDLCPCGSGLKYRECHGR